MAGVLNFAQFLGGPDNVQCEQIFPSTQRILNYNFARSISGWTFHVDYQTIVVDTVTFNRSTQEPNFSNSTVIGCFPSGVISTSSYVNVTSTVNGLVNITIPGGLYTGSILPDARANVPITVVGVTWTDNSSPVQTNTHRWAFIQNWEPSVTPGSPTASAGYTAISAS